MIDCKCFVLLPQTDGIYSINKSGRANQSRNEKKTQI